MYKETPIVERFKQFIEIRTGIPKRFMKTIYYEAGDFGVRIDGIGDISMLKTDFFTHLTASGE